VRETDRERERERARERERERDGEREQRMQNFGVSSGSERRNKDRVGC
jgi:hypothetical protein